LGISEDDALLVGHDGVNADGTGMTQFPQTIGGSDPAPSPKGGRIAFMRNGDIYLLDVTTGGLTNLTNSTGTEIHPAYSPSGKQIAFVRASVGGGIFVMNEDGTSRGSRARTAARTKPRAGLPMGSGSRSPAFATGAPGST